MSYRKAAQILPLELLRQIQEYVDGEAIYIPRMPGGRKDWGTATETREELRDRNDQIYRDYLLGYSQGDLSDKYYLSPKSIQRIIRQRKKNED